MGNHVKGEDLAHIDATSAGFSKQHVAVAAALLNEPQSTSFISCFPFETVQLQLA